MKIDTSYYDIVFSLCSGTFIILLVALIVPDCCSILH